MSDKITQLDLPVFQDLLGKLNAEDARNLTAWTTAKPIFDDITPEQQSEALVGMTAAVCSALSEGAPDNPRLQEALRTVVNEVLIHRQGIFLPPKQPDSIPGPAVPVPKTFVFLPPDPPDDKKKSRSIEGTQTASPGETD